MKLKIKLGLLLLIATSTFPVVAQPLAIKTNLLYGAYTLTPNLGLEIGLGRHSTLELGAAYNPWNLQGSESNNKKLVHLLGQLEYRYWLCQKFNGHFFGAHVLGAQYNVGGHELPLLFGGGSRDYRFEGWAAGAGLSYGYQFVLGNHWNLEATIGVGYARLQYDKYDCPKCGDKLGNYADDYWGPTKVGVSIIYTF